ncbi:GH3 auxin-responsive promoter family protein [Streptomyces sp. B1866]|uniref:GH3 auxin-responsive promoter family protein n=1 Tax=Streptomyces sp. B1866 TaxID=3075431 RepID=UPI00288EBB9C|nr:GH3 auxin-responsive promoter family protein [Streptomyces sp. B1866]MDT3398601.1 GH3 auxin-responsive promoter family protein [Streptomyces sp. B1866]
MASEGKTAPHPCFLARTRDALERQRKTCARPEEAAQGVFADIVEEAVDTAFGRDHGLRWVRTRREWQAAVPIRTYDGLAPYVDRQLAGEHRVLTADDPYAFLRTSGTTGRAKYVPTTGHWRRAYRGPALYAQWGLYFEKLGTERLAAGQVLDLSWEPGPVRRREQGFPVYGISERPLPEDAEDWNPPWRSADWFGRDPAAATLVEQLHTKLLRLAGGDVRLIVSVNPSKIVLLAETLSEHGERLIRELHDGRAPGPARRLAAVLDRAGGRPLLTDLWPGLRLLVCWNSASAALYRPWLSRLAPGVATLPFSTTGTEGIVTLPVDEHPSAGPLAVNQGDFEFVPWRDLDDGSPLPADSPTLGYDELEPGADYRLVMSQANGLYRYDVGDVYRMVDRVGATPRLEFLGRAGFQCSFTGEKVTESDVHAAVTEVLGWTWATHPDFTGIPVWGTPPYYVIAVEWTDAHDAVGPGEAARRIDGMLQDVNVEYADKRRSGRLLPLRVLPLVPGAFRTVLERRFHDGVAGAQIKHHWLQKDASFLTTLRELGLVRDGSTTGA